jgi:cell division protein FtsZ
VLLSIQGGSDLGLFEINEAAQLVANSAAPDANIIFGAVIDDALGDEVRVTVIAAGFDESGTLRSRPVGPGLARLGPDTASPVMSGAAAFPVANGEAGRDLGQSVPGGLASGASAGYAAAEHRAEQSPAVTMSEATPEVAVTTPSAAEPEPGAHSTEWSAVPAADSGSQDSTPSAVAAATSRPRADPGAAARMFDAATTRRRSVVFEEDDELDVPDFLK